MKYFIKWISCIVLVLLTLKATAGPWPLKAGSVYGQFGIYLIPPVDRLHLSPYQTRFLHRPVFDLTTQCYLAVGITNKWTLSLELPFKYVSTADELSTYDHTPLLPADTLTAARLADLGNVSTALQYNFWRQKHWLMSAQLAISFPTAIQAYNPENALRTAYPCFGIAPVLSAGYSHKNIYTSLSTGIRLRTNQYAHQWLADYEIGWKIAKGITFALQISTVYCWPGSEDVPSSQEAIQTGLYINNQNYVALTIKTMFEIKENWGLNVSLSGGLWANNVQQGPSVGAGIYYKWQKK